MTTRLTAFPGRLASRSSRSAVFVPALLLALLVSGKPAMGQAPQVNNTSGASVVVGQATLQGNLTAGVTADIYIYWGRTDGGATTNWEHVVTLPGTAQGAFSSSVSAFYGFGYSYICLASNAAGTSWSSSANFTMPIPTGQIPASQLTNVRAQDAVGGREGLKAFNGSGMTDADHHDANPGNMWMSGLYGTAGRWVIADLGGTYNLDYLRIWNYNEYGSDRSVKHADFYVGTSGFGANTNLSKAGFNSTGFTRVLQNQTLTAAPGSGSMTNSDPHVSLSNARATHLAIRAIDVYSGDGIGLSEVKIYWAAPLAITNTPASNVAATTAALNGQLLASHWVCDVYVGWGTNDAGTNLGAWAHSALVGTFSNFAGVVSNNIAGLSSETRYYYTFFASNTVTNICAQPAGTFRHGAPTVSNTTATPYVGYATLDGTVSDSIGAKVLTYWGDNDGGTTNTAWDHVITNGTGMADGAFSSNTATVFYGKQYYYRCYATNSQGESWATSSTPFLTASPAGHIPPSQLTSVRWQDCEGSRDGTKLFSGSGMYDDNDHNVDPSYQWLASNSTVPKWMIVALGGAYNLDYLRIWNYNEFGDSSGSRNTQTADFYVSTTGFGNNTTASGGSLDTTGFTRVLQNQTLNKSKGGGGAFTNTDPHVSLDLPRATHLAINTLSVYSDKPGLAEVKIFWSSPLRITNTAPGNLTATAATLNGNLLADNWSCDVYVGWGTNDAGTSLGSWAQSGLVGAFTNYSGEVSNNVSDLTPGTRYYYTFFASNAVTNICVQPSYTFRYGPPTVSNTTAAVGVGYASLGGTIVDSAGATVKTYWGANDGGTTSTAWDFVLTNGTAMADGAFSSTSVAYYGRQYYYRCYATNSQGEAWAPAATPFLTTFPTGQIPPGQLTITWQNNDGTRTGTKAFDGTGMLDADHHNSNPEDMLLWSGGADRWLIAALGGAYNLDHVRIWNYNEYNQTRGVKTADFYVSTAGVGGNVHLSGASFNTSGWTRVLQNRVLQPASGSPSITNTDPAVSLGLTRATHLAIHGLDNYNNDSRMGLSEVKIYWASPLDIANTVASEVAATTATLNGQLLAANWSCDVYVGWGTNDAGTNLASWATNKLVGTFNSYVGAVSNNVAGLTEGTRYYYAFFAQSAVSNLCAQPAGTFQYSRATVSNTTSTPSVGYAALGGTISDSVGSTVRTYWGDNDGGTNRTAWDYAITNGVNMPDGPFVTNTPPDLLCGRQYFYRCYATNSLGESWAPATTPFFTAFPRGQIPAIQIGTNVITQNELGDRQGYKAFDGTGMLDADYHNNNPGYSNMWCSGSGPADRWVIAALGGAYNLDYLRIWNYTEAGGAGRGTRQADIFVSATGFGNNVHQSSASFDASGFTRVLANATFAPYPGGDSFTNTDPHVSLDYARATHLAIRALSNYGADLVGLGEVKIYWASPLNIANRPPTNITPTSATLKADLIAEGWSCDVYVGWGTNDAGTNLTGWATNAFLGTITNYTGPVSHDVQITPLTHYYYAFCVSNAMTNIWAQPSRALYNGAPAVSNTFATAHDFYADLAGTIRGANWATVRTYWGDNDGGTNMTSWDFVITNGISLDDCDFSASTTRDLRFFGNYYYRCYATNSIGESWAPDSTLFSPLPPPPLGPHDTILIIR